MGKISLIVAVDKKYGIAKNGAIPWKCPADMKLFRYLTTLSKNSKIVMGRRTWETLKAPLKGRRNIVISATIGASPGIDVFKSPQEFLDSDMSKDGDIWIIGGRDIYMWFIERGLVNEGYMTVIPDDYECDLFLPLNEYFKLYPIDSKKIIGYELELYKFGL